MVCRRCGAVEGSGGDPKRNFLPTCLNGHTLSASVVPIGFTEPTRDEQSRFKKLMGAKIRVLIETTGITRNEIARDLGIKPEHVLSATIGSGGLNTIRAVHAAALRMAKMRGKVEA